MPKTVVFKINEIKNQISSYENAIVQNSQKREQLQENFAADAQRYKKIIFNQHQEIKLKQTIACFSQ